jgi:DNA ligase (NAD+)
MTNDIKKQIDNLRRLINEHDYKYYVLNAPTITDSEYDKLFSHLKELETKHPDMITPDSPTQRVSGRPILEFSTVAHSLPMLSIDNTYNEQELSAFDERIAKNLGTKDYQYTVELKIDGLAISLRYEDGILTQAATRGDGTIGDDVTVNVRTIKSVPLRLVGTDYPKVLEVRGEVYMPIKAFNDLNEKRVEAGEREFANPRNAAAGSLKLLDPETTAQRKLSFFAYALGQTSQPIATNHFTAMNRFKDFGLPINENISKAADIDEVIKICRRWDKERHKLDYMTDGMVIKIDRFTQRDMLGTTGRAPRWCIAYKFAAEQAETVVESIDLQVGKTGVITPVANLTPVKLAGTTVKRASLHNFDEIERLDVAAGDTVIIEKAGEIIPQVISVKQKGLVREPFAKPVNCPVCSEPVKKDENGVYYKCHNSSCPAVIREKIIYFAGKAQMDIDSFGPALVDQLLAKKLIKNFADIYKLTFAQVSQLPRMGDKSAEKVLESIDKSKTQTLARFIAALGINNVGTQSAEILADNFANIDSLMNATQEQLCRIDQVGPVMAKSIYDYFHNEKNVDIINQMFANGVSPSHEKTIVSDIFAGQKIVVTGTLENFSRDQIEQTIKDNGGKVSSSVSKKTSFVLAGSEPGSKVDKAQSLGVKIISESEFMKILGKE